MSSNENVQVAIVGAGPVGLTCALTLANNGVEVAVLDKEPGSVQYSRASTFHPASLEYLEALGVVNELLSLGIKAPVFQLRERRGDVVAAFDLRALSDVTAYPFRLQCEQHKLCEILRSRLSVKHNVKVRFSSDVVKVDSNESGGVVTCSDGSRVSAKVIIGADGAHSKVRDSLKLPLEGMTYPERFLIISTNYDVSEAIADLSHVSYIADPHEWVAVIHSPDHWRLLFPVMDSESDEEASSLDRCYQRVADFVEKKDLENFTIDDITVYRVHRRAAKSMIHDRVYLIGDAAHLNNPLGGQGMNSGIHDAVTLANNLTGCFSSEIPWSAMNEWAQVRRNVASTYVGSDTHANYLALVEKDPDRRVKWRRELTELVEDKDALHGYLSRSAMLNTYKLGQLFS